MSELSDENVCAILPRQTDDFDLRPLIWNP